MDIAAYDGSDCKGADYGDSAPAAAALADAARKEPDASALSRVDVSGGYAIYTIPYLSLAYQASGTEGADGHSSAALKAAMVDYLAGIPTNSAGVDEVIALVTLFFLCLPTYMRNALIHWARNMHGGNW